MGTVRVSKLGYVGFETPDVDRMVEYYTKVLDFHSSTRRRRGVPHHRHRPPLRRASPGVTRRPARSSATSSGRTWTTPQQRLKEAGYETQRRSDIGPGTPDVLVLEEPGTGVPLHLVTSQDPSGVSGYTPLRPTKLGPRRGLQPRAWTRCRASTRICSASGGPTPSATSSCSCAATPTTTRRTSWRARSSRACTTSPTRCATPTTSSRCWTTSPSRSTGCTGDRAGTGRATTCSPTTATPTATSSSCSRRST